MSLSRRDFVGPSSIGVGLASVLEIVSASAESSPTASQGTKIINLDDRVSFKQQLERNVGPVVLMSTFPMPPDQIGNFLAGFRKQLAIMPEQPGLISARLHRGIADSSLFMNYIAWESVDAFKLGYELPEFQAQLKQYPAITVVSASFFQRDAVAGMCVGEGSIAAE
jgi:heme-degrading monooxygenase HmoA